MTGEVNDKLQRDRTLQLQAILILPTKFILTHNTLLIERDRGYHADTTSGLKMTYEFPAGTVTAYLLICHSRVSIKSSLSEVC